MGPGQLRVAIALRAIGEGHLSSIEFAEAVIGPGTTWTFHDRRRPPWRPQVSAGAWSVAHFRAAAAHEGVLNETSHAVLRELPTRFSTPDIDTAATLIPSELSSRADTRRQIDALRVIASSAYRAGFPLDTELSQRVLSPVAAEEHRGMEDARFVRFTDTDGSTHYRATYTAYDGRDIAPRLIITPDLRDFRVHRLVGDGAQNKGMAMFPRPVDGRYLALSRTGGENISLAESDDGVIWTQAGRVHGPQEAWEIVQTGNCGPPLETEQGWIVLTHGVGPMRTYALGALLLDLHNPTKVLGRTSTPILEPHSGRRDGYVPNVAYSCGGIIHEGVLWIPIGIADSRIGVCSVELTDLLASMT
ncbi:glycosylase [Microbacterium sp. Leaf351]|nr:glycosylase [Microbacterium sp. Leaf351]